MRIFERNNMPIASRIVLLLCLIGLTGPQRLAAQHLHGKVHAHGTQWMKLLDTRGGDHAVIDSARIDSTGRFSFAPRNYEAGFYQLAISDTDRMDLILDPREEQVLLEFDGLPLQENVIVRASVENQRMWEYKMIGRESQAQLEVIQQKRATANDDERFLRELDQLEIAILDSRQQALERSILQDTTSHFAQVVRADQELSELIAADPLSIAHGFEWTNDRLFRSSVYGRAILAWMRTAPPLLPDGLVSASDSLLLWTRPHPEAWAFTRSLLIRLFDQYGPEFVSQYLVDRYVAGPEALVPADEELLRILVEQLKVSVGAKAPDVNLPSPGAADTLSLHHQLPRSRFTVVFFYASTCEHCHEQIPHLNMMYTEYGRDDLQIIGIALDADATEFLDLLRDMEIPWPAFSELIGWGSPAAKAFQVKATPSLFLLDQDGTIRAKPYDHHELRAELKRLLQ